LIEIALFNENSTALHLRKDTLKNLNLERK